MTETNYKVLIVDDTPSVIDVIKEVLLIDNYQIAIATSGEKALKKIPAIRPDLILLDILMPGIDGYETCIRIKALPECEHTPVIFVSALTESFDKVKAFNSGAVDYISKPINNEELSARIKTHLQNSNYQQKISELNKSLEQKVLERTRELGNKNEELKESNTRYQLVIDGAQVGTFERNIETDKVIRNQVAASLIGYTMDEIGDNNDLWLSLIHPDDVPKANLACAMGREAKRHETFSIDYRIKHKLGHWVWLRCRGKITKFDEKNRPLMISGVFIDISNEKEAENAIRRSEENFRLLSEFTLEGILIHENGIIININAAFTHLLGVNSPKDLIGLPLPMDMISPESIDLARINMANKFSGKYELKATNKDGASIILELETSDILYQDKKMRLVAARDITFRKRNELLAAVRLSLLENYDSLSAKDVLFKMLDEIKSITNSRLGFYHFVGEQEKDFTFQAWSSVSGHGDTLNKSMTGKSFPIPETGIMADCIQQRKSIVNNDKKQKKGKKDFPKNHVPLDREMLVPVLRHGNIVAIAGIGNKPHPYTENDVVLVEQIVDMAWDFVERKKVEQALMDSEKRFKTIFQESQSVMFILNPENGKMTDANESALSFYGYTREEFSQLGFNQISNLEVQKNLMMMQSLATGRQNHLKTIHYLKSGENRNVEVFSSPIVTLNKVALFCIVVDRTSEVKAQEEIQMINRRFEGLENIIYYNAKSINDLLDFTIVQILDYTKSDLGFLYHYKKEENIFLLNNWSNVVDLSYRPEQMGIDSDQFDCLNQAVTSKEPIIVNQAQRSYPFLINGQQDHVAYKSVSIPVVVNKEVIAVVWLGSKTKDYSSFDAEQVSLLLETAWILVDQQRLHDELRNVVL